MSKISLTLESKKSVFDGKIFMESINTTILKKLLETEEGNKLLKTYDKITEEDIYTNEFVKKTYCTEKNQLQKYIVNSKFGRAFVKYNKTRKLGNYGRVIPFKSLGLFSFRKQIRGALAYGIYTDIDIQNCHPCLLVQIAEQNELECKYLKKYVNKREKYLNMVVEHYGVTKDKAKTLFITLLYFGSFKTWAEKNNITKEEIGFVTNFKNELKNIGNALYNSNPHFVEILKNKIEFTGVDKKNIVSSVVSFILQEYECQIIEHVYSYCVSEKIINDDCVIAADGLMIKSDKYDDSLLTKFSEIVKDKFGFDLVFVKKELNTEIYDILK